LEGRRIQDAIGTAFECLHSIAKKKKNKSLILKLDLRKAYDCVDWDFLHLILNQVGFGSQMTRWIMSCVTSPSYVVLINGEVTDFFKSERGLRQGCPLSPLLFILVMEALSLLLKKSKVENKLSGVKVSNLINILHLLFVDDVLILSKADLSEWKEIFDLINLFCKVTGLQVNSSKTTVHFEGLSDAELIPLKSLLPYTFSALNLGFKYLGFHLKTGPQRVADWAWLLTKIEKKIGNWCYRWLSLGGRYVLLKSVLESQPVYWMAVELLPKFVIAQIRKLCFKFLWNGNLSSSHIHLCSWEVLSRPKSSGGWGLRDLTQFQYNVVGKYPLAYTLPRRYLAQHCVR
jgi:hypothetical protein